MLIHVEKKTRPSDENDPRHRLVRSPHCPNSMSMDPTCGNCAWGFYTKEGAGEGEHMGELELTPLHAGYNSQCGQVMLFRDKHGRVGAVRENRFFPGIRGNEAFERYLTQNPRLAS